MKTSERAREPHTYDLVRSTGTATECDCALPSPPPVLSGQLLFRPSPHIHFSSLLAQTFKGEHFSPLGLSDFPRSSRTEGDYLTRRVHLLGNPERPDYRGILDVP